MTDNRRDQEVGEWLAHPQTEEFFRYVSAQAEYVDTVGRASAYIPGEPFKSAENMAGVQAALEQVEWISDVTDTDSVAHEDCFYPVIEDE